MYEAGKLAVPDTNIFTTVLLVMPVHVNVIAGPAVKFVDAFDFTGSYAAIRSERDVLVIEHDAADAVPRRDATPISVKSKSDANQTKRFMTELHFDK